MTMAVVVVLSFFAQNLFSYGKVLNLIKKDIELDLMISSAQAFADKIIDEGKWQNYSVANSVDDESVFDLLKNSSCFKHEYNNYKLGVCFVLNTNVYYVLAKEKQKNKDGNSFRRYKECVR